MESACEYKNNKLKPYFSPIQQKQLIHNYYKYTLICVSFRKYTLFIYSESVWGTRQKISITI